MIRLGHLHLKGGITGKFQKITKVLQTVRNFKEII